MSITVEAAATRRDNIDWVLQSAEKLFFEHETKHLATGLFDRYLLSQPSYLSSPPGTCA